MIRKAILVYLLCVGFVAYSQKKSQKLIQSGPMLGYTEMREVMIWLQTTTPKPVHIKYYIDGKPERKWSTDVKIPKKEDYYTLKFVADSVEPGKKYIYEVYVEKKNQKFPYELFFRTQIDWAHKTPAPDFKLVAGSCVFNNDKPFDRPGEPYGGENFIFNEIYKCKPDIMMWLGDNTYLRPADWGSRTGILKRYTYDRGMPEIQPLLASTHHYAIWDDHDFGPNDASYSYSKRHLALEAFKLFWPNPDNGGFPWAGITNNFTYADAEFFMLDNRWNRTERRVDGSGHILGIEQEDWLIDALKASRANFKIVCVGGQFLNSLRVFENHSQYAIERQRILQRINNDNISGVVFLTGDRHFSEISTFQLPNGARIWDVTTSPMTSSPFLNASTEYNQNRVPGSLLTERSFAEIEFKGVANERQMVVKFINNKGGVKFQYSIRASDFYQPIGDNNKPAQQPSSNVSPPKVKSQDSQK